MEILEVPPSNISTTYLNKWFVSDKLIFDKDQNGNDVATIVMTRKGGKIQKIYQGF